jgi:hypothetical protein
VNQKFLLLISKSLSSEERDFVAEAGRMAQRATAIVYVATKARKKSKSVPPADGGEGREKE